VGGDPGEVHTAGGVLDHKVVQTVEAAAWVTEHQDLDVLGCIGASEQRQPAQHSGPA